VTLFTDSLQVHRGEAIRAGIVDGFEALAGTIAQQAASGSTNGQTRRARSRVAAWLFGAAEALREMIGSPVPPAERAAYERDRATLRAALGAQALAAAWAEGRASDWRDAAETALRLPSVLDTLLPEAMRAAPRDAWCGAAGGPSLSRREREVALLVARGRSNRQIATDLVIVERTVESHVTHILAKLGLASRSQIVAWVVSRGLLAQPEQESTPTVPRGVDLAD
jgi:DNA-binding NarL/FixJ family response regulator